jgi:hypothetical protein
MRKTWKIVVIVAMVAVLGVATVAAVAYAQDATTGSSAVWDFGQKVKQAIAEALGISVEEYDETVTAAQTQVLDEAVSEGVLTEEQADRMRQHLDSDGFDGPGIGHGPSKTSLLMTVAAEKLGMTEAELRTELQNGKSIADLAEEKNLDTQVISDTYLEQLQADLDAQVADGSLTQEEADAKLADKTEALADRLTGTWRHSDSERGDTGRGFLGSSRDEIRSLLMTVAAEKLGMNEAELGTELQNGKSIADLAEEKTVDTQVISDAYLEQLKADLDAQVADGSLTQEEADAKLEQKTEALPDRLTGTWHDLGHPSRGGRGGRPGAAPDLTGEDEL